MIVRGSKYQDSFNFKNVEGQLVLIGNRKFEIVMYRNNFVRKYDEDNGLTYYPHYVVLTIPAAETSKFKFDRVFYTVNEIFEDGTNTIFSGDIDIQ